MAAPAEDWRSPNKRKLVIQKLEESFKGLSNPPTNLQNPVEVEKALFEKSKNLEEYRNNFHNVILMLTRQKHAHQAQPNPMMAAQRPMMPGQQQMMNQPYQQSYNQYGGGMGGGPNQVPHNPAYQPGMGTPQPRPQQPPQYHPGMYPSGGNPNAGMQHMQQQQQHQYQSTMGMVPGYPQQGRPMPGSNFAAPHNMMGGGNAAGFNNGGMPGAPYNQQMMSGGMPHGGMIRQPVMRPGPMVQGQRPGIQGQPPFIMDNVGVQPVTVPNPSYSGQSAIRPPASSAAYPGVAASTGQQFNSHQAPSPYGMVSAASPATPQQPPAVTGTPQVPPGSAGGNPPGGPPDGVQTQHPGVPGPANPPTPRAANLHGPVPSPAPPTPLCPASPATSGIGSPATQPAMTPEENEAYLRKLGELQKYIPLMSKWISRLSKDDRKSDQFLKLKSLHNLLQDNNKRVPLQTLMKCEIALEKMFKESPDPASSTTAGTGLSIKNPNSIPPPASSSLATTSSTATAAVPIPNEPVVPEPKFSAPPQSQSLLDFKMSHSPPATYSILAETIGPRHIPIEHLPIFDRVRAARALPYPQSLRLELPHLGKFNIEFAPKEDNTDKTTTATVSLADENLPEVPSLVIVIPHTYPTISPICDLSHYKTPTCSTFVKLVGSFLGEALARQPRYSFSTLLNTWELCVLRAMSRVLNSEDE